MSNNFYFIVSVILFSILCSSNSVAQQLNVINDERPDKTISQYSVSDSVNYAAKAIDLSSYNTIDPTMTWGHTLEWKNPQINFSPFFSKLIQAGDLNGDGYEDFISNHNSWDERTNALDDRVSKTLIYFGPDNLTEPSTVIYDYLLPVGDILGNGTSQLVSPIENDLTLYEFNSDGSYETRSDIIPGLSSPSIFSYPFTFNALMTDLDGNQTEDLLGYIGTEIRIGFMDTNLESSIIHTYQIENYVENGSLNIENVNHVEWDGTHYLIVLLNNNSTRGQEVAVFALDEQREINLIQWLELSENTTRNTLIQLLKGPDNFPNILISGYDLGSIYSGPGNGKFIHLHIQGDDGRLYKKSKNFTELEEVSIRPVGDLNGNGWSDILYSTNQDIRYAIINPADTTISVEGLIGTNNQSFSDLRVNLFEFQPQGDLNNDGFDDFQFYLSSDDMFGPLRINGVQETGQVPYQNPSAYLQSKADYRVTSIVGTYVFGDLTGNGLDEYGLVVYENGVGHLDIYEGGTDRNIISSIELERQLLFATSGDFDTDGREDILLLVNQTDEDANSNSLVNVLNFYKLGEDEPYRTITRENYQAGISNYNNQIGTVANAGDINNDGLDDIIVAAPGNRVRHPIGIYLGGMTSVNPDLEISFPDRDPNNYNFGWGGVLQGGFDFNGDGIDDFIIGNTDETDINSLPDDATYIKSGAVHLFYGQNEEVDFTNGPDVTFTSDDAAYGANIRYQYFAFNEVAFGDFNGDGSTDLAIKPYSHTFDNDERQGRAGIHIFHGGKDFDSEPDQLLPLLKEIHNPFDYPYSDGEVSDTTAKSARALMTGVPDINGDGADELLYIGPGERSQGSRLSYFNGEGNGSLFFGGEAFSNTPDVVIKAPNQRFGLNDNLEYKNRQYRTAIGEITREGVSSVLLWQQGDTNYRDTPAYLYELTNLAVSNEEVASDLPDTYSLDQNYPNPFNPSTQIQFTIPQASDVKLTVYNVLGQQVKTLVDEFMQAGSHTARFDARNLSSGMYIYRLEAGSVQLDGKMMLIK